MGTGGTNSLPNGASGKPGTTVLQADANRLRSLRLQTLQGHGNLHDALSCEKDFLRSQGVFTKSVIGAGLGSQFSSWPFSRNSFAKIGTHTKTGPKYSNVGGSSSTGNAADKRNA